MERPDGLVRGCIFNPSIDVLCDYHREIVQNPIEFSNPFIRFAEVYLEPPDQLTARYWADEDNRVWYFFTMITLKSAENNGGKKTWASRSVGPTSKCPTSKWRGSQVKPMENRKGRVIGLKRSFEYMVKTQGSKKGFKKTPWLMEEYRFTTNSVEPQWDHIPDELHEWVICKIYLSPRAQRGHPLSISPSVPCKQTSSTSCDDIVVADVGVSNTLVPEEMGMENFVETSLLIQSEHCGCNSLEKDKAIIEADDCMSLVDDEITPLVPPKRRRIETVEVEDSTLCNPSFIPARSEVMDYQPIGSSQTTDDHEAEFNFPDFYFEEEVNWTLYDLPL